MGQLKRMWVNQPSTLQRYHELHGTNVLYDPKEEVIYFLEGNVISQQIDPRALSEGWETRDVSGYTDLDEYERH